MLIICMHAVRDYLCTWFVVFLCLLCEKAALLVVSNKGFDISGELPSQLDHDKFMALTGRLC